MSVIVLSPGRVDKLSRMMQIVDDGSGVIDCCIPYIKVDHAKLVSVQEARDPKPKEYRPRNHTSNMSDYYPKETIAPPRRLVTPPPEWKPSSLIPDIGDTIRVEGKLRSGFGERIVLIDRLGMCFSNTIRCCYLILASTHRTLFYES